MTKIKNLHMADAVIGNNDIKVESRFFGFAEKVTYLPTESPVNVRIYDYTASDGEQLANVLSKNVDEMAQMVQDGKTVKNVPIGNVRAETCMSADHKFLMIQLLRYIDFDYRPLSDVRIFVGPDAEVAASLFAEH